MENEPLWKTVPGMHMSKRERLALKNLAAKTAEISKRPTIVNIGIAAEYGYCSMRCLRAGNPNAVIVGMDIQDQGEVPGDLDPSSTSFFIGDSKEMLLGFPFTTHMAFVDGDHTEEGVAGDIYALLPLIPVGGYIAFHDYGHVGPGFEHVAGVRRAVDKAFNGREGWEHVADIDSLRIFRRVS